MLNVYNVTGVPGSESFLIEVGGRFILFDAGFACAVHKTIKNIKEVVGDRSLDFLLLSHSHYDHVMGSPAIKEAFPGVKVVANKRVDAIFKKENARKTMRELDAKAAAKHNLAPRDDSEKLHVDICVSDGDVLYLREGDDSSDHNDSAVDCKNIGDVIEIIETPGHTHCSTSYYFPKQNFIALSESLGLMYDPPLIVPEFVTSYDDAINSIDKIEKISPEYILLPHLGLLTPEYRHDYFIKARKSSKRMRDIILDLYKNGKNIDEILQACKEYLYEGNYATTQPLDAFLMNRRVMVERVINQNQRASD